MTDEDVEMSFLDRPEVLAMIFFTLERVLSGALRIMRRIIL